MSKFRILQLLAFSIILVAALWGLLFVAISTMDIVMFVIGAAGLAMTLYQINKERN